MSLFLGVKKGKAVMIENPFGTLVFLNITTAAPKLSRKPIGALTSQGRSVKASKPVGDVNHLSSLKGPRIFPFTTSATKEAFSADGVYNFIRGGE